MRALNPRLWRSELLASLLRAFDAQVVPHMRDWLVHALVAEAAASTAAPLTQIEDAMTTDAPFLSL